MLKYTIVFSMLASAGFAATQTITPKDTLTSPPASPPAQGPTSESYMMITPAARAMDFQQAFDQLRKEKTAGKVYFQLADGTTIANVIDLNLMSNSTLVVFRYNSSQGVRFQVVKIEDIVNIFY